jgi:hypothetical protein
VPPDRRRCGSPAAPSRRLAKHGICRMDPCSGRCGGPLPHRNGPHDWWRQRTLRPILQPVQRCAARAGGNARSGAEFAEFFGSSVCSAQRRCPGVRRPVHRRLYKFAAGRAVGILRPPRSDAGGRGEAAPNAEEIRPRHARIAACRAALFRSAKQACARETRAQLLGHHACPMKGLPATAGEGMGCARRPP